MSKDSKCKSPVPGLSRGASVEEADDRQGRTMGTQKGLADILSSREGPFSVSQ